MGQAESAGAGGNAKVEDRYYKQKIKLGQGSFGTVWRAVDRTNERVVAMKELNKAEMPKRGVTREDVKREVELMKAVRHENITILYDTFEDRDFISLALEYCDGGDFGDKVKERGMNLTETECADYMAQICGAIQALQAKTIVHRDIKPDNFMVSGTGDKSVLKLTDFGLACFLTRGKLLQDKCGTPAFMAPEQVLLKSGKSRGYSFPCDMWAAGITMYMLMFGGRHPFLTPTNQLDDQALLAGRQDFRESSQPSGGFLDGLLGGAGSSKMRFTEQARQVCTAMVQPNAASRLTPEDALKHPWIASGLIRRRSSSDVSKAASRPMQNGAEASTPVAAKAATPTNAAAQRRASDPNVIAQQQAMARELEAAKARNMSLETKNANLQNALKVNQQRQIMVPPQTQVPQALQKPGALRIGLRCRYYSSSYGWIPAVVQGINDQDSTFNLDARQHAAPMNISPMDKPSCNEDIWPAGTWVTYESSSHGVLPGIVHSHNPGDCTYNLDVREHAAADKIRARIGEGAGGSTPMAGGDEMRTEGCQWRAAPDGMRTEKTSNPQGGFDPEASQSPMDGGHGAYYQQQPHVQRATTPSAQAQAGPQARPPDGSKCFVLEQQSGYQAETLPAIIEGYTQSDGSYSVLVMPQGARRRQQVRPEMIRAPNTSADAWQPGTQVCYESASLGTWLPAVIVSFNVGNSTYNLDVRENANPQQIRPR